MKDYLDSASAFSLSLKELFNSFSVGKFVKIFLVAGILTSIGILGYEFFSSHFYYEKLQKRIEIISRVKTLGHGNVEIKNASERALLEVLYEVNPTTSKKSYFGLLETLIKNESTNSLLKILGAAIMPFLVVISTWNNYSNRNAIIGAIGITFIFGIISVMIPTIYYVWVNMVLIIMLEILALIPFMKK